MITKVNKQMRLVCEPSAHDRSLQSSASYFLGDSNNDTLQRIYGISFPDKKQLVEYKQFLLEAAKRDHRKLGKVTYSTKRYSI
jgi:threonyl-tRNA synthetase